MVPTIAAQNNGQHTKWRETASTEDRREISDAQTPVVLANLSPSPAKTGLLVSGKIKSAYRDFGVFQARIFPEIESRKLPERKMDQKEKVRNQADTHSWILKAKQERVCWLWCPHHHLWRIVEERRLHKSLTIYFTKRINLRPLLLHVSTRLFLEDHCEKAVKVYTQAVRQSLCTLKVFPAFCQKWYNTSWKICCPKSHTVTKNVTRKYSLLEAQMPRETRVLARDNRRPRGKVLCLYAWNFCAFRTVDCLSDLSGATNFVNTKKWINGTTR
jgi:hypothetical protein